MADNVLQPGAVPANPDVRYHGDHEILQLPDGRGGVEVLFLAPMTPLHRATVESAVKEKAEAQLGGHDTMPGLLDPCEEMCPRCSFNCRATRLLLKNLDKIRIERARRFASAGGRC